MSNETRTYISAVIMKNMTGPVRDSIADEIENGSAGGRARLLGGELREVYLPSAVLSNGQSKADQLRAQAYKLLLQAEVTEAEERAPRPYIAHDGPAGILLVEAVSDDEDGTPEEAEDWAGQVAEFNSDAIYFLHPYETQEV